MAWFGFCAALFLTWEGGGGLLVHFILSKIAIFEKKIFSSKIVSFESKTNYQHWSTRTNSAVWQVPYACVQTKHPSSGSYGQLFLPYWGSSACRV